MIYIPSFIKICSGVQKLLRGIHRHADRIENTQTYFRKLN
jgi:hypothetical protein